jgi:ribosomal protein S18 acetylase RimI-like enzyme
LKIFKTSFPIGKQKKRNTSANSAYLATACSVPPQAFAHICQRSPCGHIIPLANIRYARTLYAIFALHLNMKEVKLRQYESSDQEAVWQLHVDGLNQTGSFVDDRKYDQDLLSIKKTYLEKGSEFFVASLNKQVIGMGALRKIDNQTAEIKRMRVNIAHQNQGIGSLILDSLIQRAKELGYKRLILDTTENQNAAKRLYEKRGFKEFKRGKAAHLETIYYELVL